MTDHPESDWRLQGQERYLTGAALRRRPYRTLTANPTWDHDHCEFCSAKFTDDENPKTLHEGYTTDDEYHWVCCECFRDFREKFSWRVEE